MPMRNGAEMRCKTLLSRKMTTQENNVKITDFLGGSNILLLSQVLTYNSLYIIKKREYSRQDTAFLASMQGRPHCFLSPSSNN